MKIAIENKIITQTATNIGVVFTEISETTAKVKWSLNDENEMSIIEGNETFDAGIFNEVMGALFTKLDITKKTENNATIDTTTSNPKP